MPGPPVMADVSGPVARITLNRPRSGNRIDSDLAEALRQACLDVVGREEVAVLVLGANGPSFCSGSAPLPQRDRGAAMLGRRVADVVAALPFPVVGVLQGNAIGQGLELALACDIRLAATNARFAMDHVPRGEVPWDGGTQRLPRAISRGLAVEMIITGRALSAQEALDAGLVTGCFLKKDLLPRSLELAKHLSSMAPIAAAYAKEAVYKGLDMSLGQGMRLEADLAILLQTTSDRSEGIRSFMEKRGPRFTRN